MRNFHVSVVGYFGMSFIVPSLRYMMSFGLMNDVEILEKKGKRIMYEIPRRSTNLNIATRIFL